MDSNGIVRHDDGNRFPLTHAQKRIWYSENINPGTSQYNIGGPVRVKGYVDLSILEEAIQSLIIEHEGVRLRFTEQEGEVRQYVCAYERIPFDIFDFSSCDEPESAFRAWVDEEAGKPFSLEDGRLFYFALFRISDKDKGYFAKFHHLIADGWSISIMTRHICDAYEKLTNGESTKGDPAASYIQYLEQERTYLASERFAKDKTFWNGKFAKLPDTFLKKSSLMMQGKRKTFELAMDASSSLRQLAADHKCSLNTIFVSLYLIYLNKTTLENDIVLGIPVLNRSGKKEKSIFGTFTSTMPFRYVVEDASTASRMIVQVNKELTGSYFHQKYPYDLLQQDAKLRMKGYDSLFNSCVNYYNTQLNLRLNGWPIVNLEFYNGCQSLSLQIVIKDWSASGNLMLDFDYKTNDYTDEQIDRMFAGLCELVKQIVFNPEITIADLQLIYREELEANVRAFNETEADYPRHKTIDRLFEEQVVRTPNKTAIRHGNIRLSYTELNEAANRLASYLKERRCGEGTVVALMATHSIELVVGILGILKADAAYLPIDPGYAADRIRYMLSDSDAAILLTNLDSADELRFERETVKLHRLDLESRNADNLPSLQKEQKQVYMIYTSGSTGRPKGTIIEHRGLVNYTIWAAKMYVKSEDEKFALYSSLSFDLTVTSIFTPLISGGTILVYADDEEEYVLYRIMNDNEATVIKLTPSHLSLLKDRDHLFSSVQRFIVGGEDLKTSLARSIHESFGGKVEIFNEYGPTETVVGCMIHLYDVAADTGVSVPIGVPADNVQVYLLDSNGNHVPMNVMGELYIAGDGVARGYLNRPDLTAEKFIPNFVTGTGMLYKTGDLARFVDYGLLEYAGRADGQLMLRGYRIEPGEIEHGLEGHDSVTEALVIAREDRQNSAYLCAYLLMKNEVPDHLLRDWLSMQLPEYMIPRHFVRLDAFPLTSNGKIDRASLPEPPPDIVEPSRGSSERGEEETELIGAIAKLLNIGHVNGNHSFYALGGDSIKAIQLSSQMRERGYSLKVKDILSHPVISQMAMYLVKQQVSTANVEQPCVGSLPHTPIVAWFLSQQLVNPNHYNQSVMLELKRDVSKSDLESMFSHLILHHDALRLNYDEKSDRLFYNELHGRTRPRIEEYDLTEFQPEVQLERMRYHATAVKASLDIGQGALMKMCLYRLGPHGQRLLVTAHHLVVDGVSWRIILNQLSLMMGQLENGQPVVLPPKTDSYLRWAETLSDAASAMAVKEKSFWEQEASYSFVPFLEAGERAESVDKRNLSANLDQPYTDKLLTSANRAYHTKPSDLLTVCLLRTLREWTCRTDLVIELESHGREDLFDQLDIQGTVGWFTSLYPFRIQLEHNEFDRQIKTVKERLRNIPNNGIGYGIVKYLAGGLEESLGKDLVRLNYLGDLTNEFDKRYFKASHAYMDSDHSKDNRLSCLTEINCWIAEREFHLTMTYDGMRLSDHDMHRFVDMMMENLEILIDHCYSKSKPEFTASDFDAVDMTQDELDSLFQ